MSIDERNKSSGGRPKVDAEMVSSQLERPILDALDAWIAAKPEPRPSRAEAIRRLLAEALGKSGGAETIATEDLNASNDE